MQKVGGAPLAALKQVQQCIAHARLHYKGATALLKHSMLEHSVGDESENGQ